MEGILTNFVSTLMLPVFVIMILCAMAGAKPEPIAKAFIDLITAIIVGLFKLAGQIIEALLRLHRAPASDRTTPRRRSRS